MGIMGRMAQPRMLYLRAYLDGDMLCRLWRRLWLPRKVRSLWESRFPSLPRVA